jgi:hypothetical protein
LITPLALRLEFPIARRRRPIFAGPIGAPSLRKERLIYLVLNFYQINGDGEIRTRDRLVIKALIPCQRTISTRKLKLLGEVPGYDLYYSLTCVTLCFSFAVWII